MRIITWNCNMAFRKKADFILAHKPDILIVPECEHPHKLKFKLGTPIPTDVFWFGDNSHKGLGVFSYSDYKFKLHRSHNPELKNILPLTVNNGKESFTLFAVWANNPQDPDGTFVTQVWKALEHYKKLIKRKRTILAGDFNSNTIWDKPRRKGNHSTVVEKLAAKNIHSVYHKFFNQDQGKEIHPTFYLYKNQTKPYHLDYCFTSSDFTEKIIDVQVDDYESWRAHSDHAPLIVTFK